MNLKIRDWEKILGVSNFFNELYQGLLPIDFARQLINSKRTTYPNVPFDYIKIIDEFNNLLDEAQLSLNRQNDALENLDDALDSIGARFRWDRNKFINEEQRNDIKDLEKDLQRAAREAEQLLTDASEAEEQAPR
ncbi:MAG: hypothetical protein HRT44_13405, partial [Bdellovibrionales bacterium]|nr:hypothetical protein [Bdellovibrionales bacterium]